MKHLNEKTKKIVLESSNEERIKEIQTFRWIGYTYSKNVLDKMTYLMNYPPTHRPPNMLLVGDTNNGKTAILKRFEQNNLTYIDENTNNVICPVVYIQSPSEPDIRRFYNTILQSLFAPYNTTERLENRYYRVKNLLLELKTKVLIIDEIQHLLAGTPIKQRLFLNEIKNLSSDLKIPIICSGTKAAFNAINTDPQISNRFEPKVLPLWTNDLEFKRLLISYESILPLKNESNLIENSISTKILAMSGGLLGEISKIIELSSILAIHSGTERITKEILSNIDYVSPNNRNKSSYY